MDLNGLHASVDAIEEIAEEYIFRRLSDEDAAAYERHLLVCETCRSAVETADEFIDLLRRADGDERSRVA